MSSIEATLASALKIANTAQQSLVKSNERLDHALKNSTAHGLPAIQVGPAQGQFLSILTQMSGAKSVLEIGTLGGYSTIWFAQSSRDVKVTSIEFNPKHRDVALENTKGLNNVEIILGAALDILPKLAADKKIFDFVFIDADWDEQQEYFDWAVKLSRKKGVIYVDNAVRQLTQNSEGNPKGWALIDHIKADERVQATLMPTLITSKAELFNAVDGFVIATVQ